MGLVLAEREKDRAFLTTQIGLLAIQLNKGDVERCTTLSFEVAPDSDFDVLARDLEKDGIKSELRNDSTPGIGPVLTFKDNKGTTIALFKEWSYLGKHLQHYGVGPLKLGHIAWVVDDPQKTAEFYEKVLGFKVSDWIDDFFVFMRCNTDHHTVNFIRGNNIKMHHMAFELKDFIHLQNSCDLFGQQQDPDHLGTAAPRPGPQHRHLSPQSGRSGDRILLRARQDGGREARLFRAAAVASGHAATAKNLAGRQDQRLGPAADAGFPPGAGLTSLPCRGRPPHAVRQVGKCMHGPTLRRFATRPSPCRGG